MILSQENSQAYASTSVEAISKARIKAVLDSLQKNPKELISEEEAESFLRSLLENVSANEKRLNQKVD